MAKRLILATAASALQLPKIMRGKGAAPDLEKLRFLSNDDVRSVQQDFGTPTYVYDAATSRRERKKPSRSRTPTVSQ